MTEAEWLSATNIHQMAQHILAQVQRKNPNIVPRKHRLFCCACCQRVSNLFSEDTFRNAVEVAMHFSDALASKRELQAVNELAIQRALRYASRSGDFYLDSASGHADKTAIETLADHDHMISACVSLQMAVWHANGRDVSAARSEHLAQIHLLRDIFFNPFRPPPTIDPAWLRWHDATIPRLAQQMYDARDFAAMPILADALEEAGCTDGDILDHCRGPGPHVRGCWVVDAILEK